MSSAQNGLSNNEESKINAEFFNILPEKQNLEINNDPRIKDLKTELKNEDGNLEEYINPNFHQNENVVAAIEKNSEFPESNNLNFIDSKKNFCSLPRSSTKVTELDDADEDTICGFGPFRPAWLQKWATSRSYLFLYTIIGVIHGTHYAYFIGILSTIEKRFAFKSKISGVIMTVDEITPLVFGVFVGYVGGKSHRPRMVGLGMLMHILCCLVSAMPYFIYGPAQHLTSLVTKNETGAEMCNSDLRNDKCNLDDRPPTIAAFILLFIAHFLKGFGSLAYYAIGLSYMDDNAKKKNTPLYLGIILSLRMFGPLLGYLMSSVFLKFYENPFDDPGYGNDDPKWIGGWWMGYLLQAGLLTILTIPMFLFPKRLPGHIKPSVKEKEKEGQNVKAQFLDLCKAVMRLAKNPLFVLLLLNMLGVIFGNIGFFVYLPKYMEHQFRLSSSDASLYSGPPGIATVMMSTTLGGFLIWKYKPSVKILLLGMIGTELLAAVGFLLLMIPQCPKVEMSHFGMNETGLLLESNCNFNCNCSTSAFTPVCGPDGLTTYFSPCYAGCSGERENGSLFEKKEVYESCSCINGLFDKQNDTVTGGFCVVEDCWSKARGYIISLPILHAATGAFHVAHTILILRAIHPKDKTFALGANETLISLFGFIPFFMISGAILDSACLIWEESCGESGNCWFYDIDKFRKLLHGSSAFFSFLSAVFLIGLYYMRERIRDLYEDDDRD